MSTPQSKGDEPARGRRPARERMSDLIQEEVTRGRDLTLPEARDFLSVDPAVGSGASVAGVNPTVEFEACGS